MAALRTAHRFAVRLHHRHKNFSSGPDTQLVKRLSRIENDPEQGQRHIERDRLPVPGLDSRPVTAMLRHGGFSFCWLAPLSYHRTDEGVATSLGSSSTTYGTSPEAFEQSLELLGPGGQCLHSNQSTNAPRTCAGVGLLEPVVHSVHRSQCLALKLMEQNVITQRSRLAFNGFLRIIRFRSTNPWITTCRVGCASSQVRCHRNYERFARLGTDNDAMHLERNLQ